MRVRPMLAVLACLAAFGCGGGEETAAPITIDGESSATASASPEARADDGPVPRDPVDGKLLRGTSAAATPEEKAVADVWFAYWQELFRMYETTEVDRDELYSLASGTGASGPVDYVESMRKQKVHQSGGAIAAITDIKVTGRQAVVQSCFRNTALNVNDKDVPVEQLMPYFQMKEILRKEGPDWRVSRTITVAENKECTYR